MALTNQQYSVIENKYDAVRLSHIRDMQKKLDAAYVSYPRLSHIDEEVAALNMKKLRIRLGTEESDGQDIGSKLADLSLERKALLSMAGFKDGIIEPEYDCPACKDTGYINGKKCSCFLKAEKELLYSSHVFESILESENFDKFSLDYYSDSVTDPFTKRTAREAARLAYDASVSYVENFARDGGNMYFYGRTGVGKTFLAHCIAAALIEKGVNVLFTSEARLIGTLEDDHFRASDETRANADLIFGCDLLIIDDFGACQNNSFVSSALLRVIEERYLAKKGTVITTNLTIPDLQDKYSDRIWSRISSYYKLYYLFGDDIRIQIKMNSKKETAEK